jgi:hypothetical protein
MTKGGEAATRVVVDDKPRRKSRWDVENHPEDFENAPPVMWEVEGNVWLKLTAVDNTLNMMGSKTSETSFNSPLLEAVSARVKDETAKVNSASLARYTPPKDIGIVDSPKSLRRKMEEIAMLERALTAKDMDLSPSDMMKNLGKLKKNFDPKDSLDLEAPTITEVVSI